MKTYVSLLFIELLPMSLLVIQWLRTGGTRNVRGFQEHRTGMLLSLMSSGSLLFCCVCMKTLALLLFIELLLMSFLWQWAENCGTRNCLRIPRTMNRNRSFLGCRQSLRFCCALMKTMFLFCCSSNYFLCLSL
ncbi:hypothetical protein AVEN_231180-1 [Araneus ventricosus]|uniref:Uncharacterized protein n=1 Tax=Araneus ventricosus TaxID=182803 RepID=A0A4Y2NF16_ARAVE|nr:hypothetical protein AVEN_231180-1 [Araneus ventricosus]